MQTQDTAARLPANYWSLMVARIYGILFRLLLRVFPAQELTVMIEAVEGRREE